jgi:alkaline phosphatase
MFKKRKKLLTIAVIMSVLLYSNLIGTEASSKHSTTEGTKKNTTKNVILLVADGYSTSYATNYRWYKGEESLMDSMLVGMVKTYAASSEITDSAAAATAMATGSKANNGSISISPEGEELKTIIEKIEETGKKSTGLVASSAITDATPAAFGAHANARSDEALIAPQLINNDIDVLLGGGGQYFPDSLLEEAKQKGYTHITNRHELKTNSNASKLLGLFSEDSMAPELDRDQTNEPSLAEMTASAINVLNKNKDGFFLMVEGSQIDYGGHYHDAPWIMKDIESFEKALKTATDFAKKDKNTLVIVVGDHDTGGMSVGGYNKFGSNVEILRDVTATGDFMVKKFNDDKSNINKVIKQYTNLEFTQEEIDQVRNSPNPSGEINSIISERALVDWITHGHTGVDVPIYAYGPDSHLFNGLLDNTEIPRLISKAINLKFPELIE